MHVRAYVVVVVGLCILVNDISGDLCVYASMRVSGVSNGQLECKIKSFNE